MRIPFQNENRNLRNCIRSRRYPTEYPSELAKTTGLVNSPGLIQVESIIIFKCIKLFQILLENEAEK